MKNVLTINKTLFVYTLAAAITMAGKAQAASYYVNSTGGNDSNAGTSSAASWMSITKLNNVTFKAGDKILLKSGSAWTMASGTEVHPLGSGASGNPIVIDMYEGTVKPIINGNGAVTSNAFHLANQQYWEINNLEITNKGNISDNNGSDANHKIGVYIEASSGIINHVYLKNLNVHDVYGALGKDAGGKFDGGIIMESTSSSSHFNDILIDGCTVMNADRQGITVGDIAGNTGRSLTGINYSTNVIIQNCVVDHPGGDGILMFTCQGAIVQHNLAIHTNNKSDYACSMWPWQSNETHFQYNEGYDAQGIKSGAQDDGTFGDADGDNGTSYYDWNYTHDNAGGGYMICNSTGVGTSPPQATYIRYNVSHNEMAYAIYFSSAKAATNIFIYNNTFYQPSGCKGAIFHSDDGGGTFTAKNNIFVNLGSGNGFDNLVSGTRNLDYNVFYGSNFSVTETDKDIHKLMTDPKLNGASTATINTRYTDVINNHLFQLQAGSPAIASGVVISSGNLSKDFWGNTISTTAPSRGAHEHSATTRVIPHNALVETDRDFTFDASVSRALITVTYSQKKSGYVSFWLVNSEGKKIATLANGYLGAGVVMQKSVSTSALTSGPYFIQGNVQGTPLRKQISLVNL